MTDTPALRLAVQARLTVPSGTVNDDAIGDHGNVAWVFDGATDLLPEPLVAVDSDAAWFARTLSDRLAARAHDLPANLVDVIDDLTRHAAAEFARRSRRPPTSRLEHPSAAGLVVRLAGSHLEYLAVGDCTLLVAPPAGPVRRYGIADDEAGDPWVAEHIAAAGPAAEEKSGAAGIRESLLPALRRGRERLNLVPGYGVFSITPPPGAYVAVDRLPVAAGTRLLLASDGFMRLADVYGLFAPDALFAETFAKGPPAILDLLRRTEADDQAATRWPRAKASDDASVILASVTSADP